MTSILYPIVPPDNPYLHGEPLRHFAVLVRDDSVDHVRDLVWNDTAGEPVEGMLVGDVTRMSDGRVDSVRKAFPGVDPEQVLIFDPGRQPKSLITSLLFMAGGAVLIFLSVMGFELLRRLSGGSVEQAQRQE